MKDASDRPTIRGDFISADPSMLKVIRCISNTSTGRMEILDVIALRFDNVIISPVEKLGNHRNAIGIPRQVHVAERVYSN
jgi:hypothetical protein